MKIKFITPYLPFVAYLLYFTQGLIIPEGSIYSHFCIGIVFIFGINCWIRCHNGQMSKMIFAIDLFLVINILSFLLTENRNYISSVGVINAFTQLKDIFVSFITYFISLYYSKKGKISKNFIKRYLVAFLLLSISKYVYNQMVVFEEMFEQGYYVDSITNNVGYYFLYIFCLLPLFLENRKYSLILLSASALFVLMSIKRGALLVFLAIMLLYLPKIIKQAKKYTFIIMIAIILLIGVFAQYIESNEYLLSRIYDLLEGNTSGRDSIYDTIWNYCFVNNFSFGNFIFGYGFNSSLKIADKFAHNDWFELLTSTGLIGILSYSYILSLFKKIINSTKVVEYRLCMQIMFIILFLKSFFSMGYSTASFIFLAVGYIEGCIYFEKRQSILSGYNNTIS